MSRKEEIKYIAESLIDIQVEFIEKDTRRKYKLIFYKYADLGKWYADNYDSIEVIDVVQEEE